MCCVPQKKERHRCRRVARLFAVAFFDSWSSGFLLSGSRRTRFSQGESATVSVLSRRCRDSSFFDELVFLPTAFFACFFRPICGVCRTPYPILLWTGSKKRVEGEGGRSCVPAASAIFWSMLCCAPNSALVGMQFFAGWDKEWKRQCWRSGGTGKTLQKKWAEHETTTNCGQGIEAATLL